MTRPAMFRGRMSRLPYFLSGLGLFVILLLVQPLLLDLPNFSESGQILGHLWRGDPAKYGRLLDVAIHASDFQIARYIAVGVTFAVLLTAFVVLSARRLRDMGRPGHYALIAIIPFVGFQALFAVLILLPGDAGENRYGPAPRARAQRNPAIDRGSPTGVALT